MSDNPRYDKPDETDSIVKLRAIAWEFFKWALLARRKGKVG